MTDFYRDTDHRYLHDPAFHAAVAALEAAAKEHGFTPGELKQIAFKAALNLEMRARPIMYVSKGGEQESFFGVEPIPDKPPELWPPPYPIQNDPIAVVGVRTQQGPVQTFTTPEEYEAAFPGSKAPRELYDREPITVIPYEPQPAVETDATHQRFVDAKSRLDRKIHASIEAIARKNEQLRGYVDTLIVHSHDGATKPCDRPDCEAGPGVAGYLKDGTPVFFGRTP